MGMFDWYKPEPSLNCPVCSKTLSEWQGKDADCLLFVWQQGLAHPVEHKGDGEDFQVSEVDLRNFRLPKEFGFYSYDCDCPFPVQAIGKTENEVWSSSELIRAENAKQGKNERKEQFKARLIWLQSVNNKP
jgi:hypothetical protein